MSKPPEKKLSQKQAYKMNIYRVTAKRPNARQCHPFCCVGCVLYLFVLFLQGASMTPALGSTLERPLYPQFGQPRLTCMTVADATQMLHITNASRISNSVKGGHIRFCI